MIIAAVTTAPHGSAASCVVPPTPQLPPTWKRHRKSGVYSQAIQLYGQAVSMRRGGRCQSQHSWRRAKHPSPDQVTSLSSCVPHDYGTLGVDSCWREVGSAGGMGGAVAECPLICWWISNDSSPPNRAVASLEEAEGHQHLARGHGGGCKQMSPLPAGVRGSRPREFFLYIFNTKSTLLNPNEIFPAGKSQGDSSKFQTRK